MKIERLYTIDLDIRQDHELDVARIYAQRGVGLDPVAHIGGTHDVIHRPLAVALAKESEHYERRVIHELYSTPLCVVREGHISRGYWEIGSVIDHEEHRVTRTPIVDDLAELETIRHKAEVDGATCVRIDRAEAKRLCDLKWDVLAWELDPRRETTAFEPLTRAEAHLFLNRWRRHTHDDGETIIWDNGRRVTAYGRFTEPHPAVAIFGVDRRRTYFHGDDALVLRDCGVFPDGTPPDPFAIALANVGP